MKLLLLLGALLGATAGAQIPTDDSEFLLNRLGPVQRKYNLGTMLREAHNTAVCVYDFATQGGAIASVNLKQTDLLTDCTLPKNAVIMKVIVDVKTAGVSAGAGTISLGASTTTDLKAALAASSYTGTLAGTPDGTVTNKVKITSAKTLKATIASSAVTAGHFRVFVDYLLSE